MNPEKRDYNGWILCPSTRFLGKFYYFNPATGEAVWNLGDMERRMASQHNFPQSEKWHSYPEPDCPPEETSSPWGYLPDFQVFPQPSPPFGQAMFPKYTPNTFPNMSWGMPPVYMPPMMPYNPMAQAQCWANLRAHQKQFMPEKGFHNNPYMQKVPSFNQGMNRQVFGIKPKLNTFPNPVFSQVNNREVASKPNWEILRKRSHTVTENESEKEPLFKRLRSQIDLQNENLFAERNNLYRTTSFESGIAENFSKPSRVPSFQQKNCTNHCKCCQLSKSNENLQFSSQWSKSHGNLSNIGKQKEQIFKPPQLQRHRSLESLLNPASEVSTKFSLENSFVFPLNKSDSKVSSVENSMKKVQNSTVSQSGQDKIHSESSDSKLSETDLRYILMARKKKSSSTELQETKQDNSEVKKLKTGYKDANAEYGESFSKKRVTFDLGVEDIVDGNIDDGIPEENDVADEDMADPGEEDIHTVYYVVADFEALLAEFELIVNFVQSHSYILVIPSHIFQAIESTGVDITGTRSRVLAARQISRHIARQSSNETHILVQSEEPETDTAETADPDCDPTLNTCLKLYNDEHYVMLITNNPDLKNQAIAYNIECYTTKEIKDYMGTPKPEVSFDIQKVGNTGDTSAEHCQPKESKNARPDTSNKFFLNKVSEVNKVIKNDENVQIIKSQSIVNHRNPFLDKDDDLLEETQYKIKNLKLQEKNLKMQEKNNNLKMQELNNNIKMKEKNINLDLQEKINNLKMQLKIDSQKLQERIERQKQKEKIDSQNLNERSKSQNCNEIFDSQTFKDRICSQDVQTKLDGQKLKDRIESQKLQEKLDNLQKQEIIDDFQKQQIKENLKMLERSYSQKAVNKNLNLEKENNYFQNGVDEAKVDHYTAKKKIKSINVYNLDGLLKSFSIKSKDTEERIIVRMDEFMCIFRQIMEDVLENIVKDVPGRQYEDQTKTLIQNQLSLLREIVAHDRTASALTDKLSAVLDRAYLPAEIAPDDEKCGRPVLLRTSREQPLNPNEFVKMFACGTLLVKVLRSIADDASLQEGEMLLEQLEHSLERWEFEPEPNTPATPGTGAEPRPEFKRHRGEVILYLMKNVPQWKDYQPEEHEIPPDRRQEVAKVTEKATTKVISTSGKNVGLLKLNPKKPIQFDCNKENTVKNNDKDDSKENNAKIEANEVVKSKAIRKIGFESSKQPKVKEIDVSKRENDDKELTEMLEQMMKKQPLTKRYDLKSIIVDNNEQNPFNVKNVKDCSKPDANICSKVETVEKPTRQTINFTNFNITKITKPKDIDKSTNQTNFTHFNITRKSTPKDVTDKGYKKDFNDKSDVKYKHDEKAENKTVYRETDLDLDVLDYSDMEEDDSSDDREESILEDSSSNRLVIVESDNCNDVTTTHHDQDDSSPNIEQNNDIGHENDIIDRHDIQNENDINDRHDRNNGHDISNENISNEIDIMNVNGHESENDADDENYDSGVESCEAYTIVQLVLFRLRQTFIVIKEFIEDSLTDLRDDMDDGYMSVLNQKVDVAQDSVNNMIHNLNNIIERESNPESALMPMLLKGVPEAETDKRIIKYRRVISKWLSQARVLQRSLQILQRIAQRDLQVRDLSDVSDNYSNLFE